MRRAVNSGHFNAKQNGQERRAKHADQQLAKANLKDIKNLFVF